MGRGDLGMKEVIARLRGLLIFTINSRVEA